MGKENRSILDIIQSPDRRILYAIAILTIVIPLSRPIGLPVTVAKESRDFYDTIEALPDGSTILCSPDMESGVFGELGPVAVACMRHLFSRDFKIVFVFFYRGDGPVIFTEKVLPAVEGFVDETTIGNKVYGVDWVSLGYIEGHETAMAQLASDFHFISTDQFGNSLSQLALMDEIKTAEDFDLFIDIGGGDNTAALNQFSVPYDLPAICGTLSVDYIGLLPYYLSGLYKGILMGMKGGAEYEFLLQKPGLATVANDAISTTHLVLILLIILGNAVYFYTKNKGVT
jgi:hypothetical protein